MKRALKVAFLMLFFFIIQNLWAEDIFHEVLTIADGLAQNSISHIEQDSLGYIWLATQAGLSRWNGSKVDNFPRRGIDPFTAGYIHLLKKDHRGRLWIVTNQEKIIYWDEIQEAFVKPDVLIDSMEGRVIDIQALSMEHNYLILTETGFIYLWKEANAPKEIACFPDQHPQEIWIIQDKIFLGTDQGWVTLARTETELVNNYQNIEPEFIAEGNIPDWLDNETFPVKDILMQNGTLYAARGTHGLSLYFPGSERKSRIFPQLITQKIFRAMGGKLLLWDGENKLILFDPINESWEDFAEIPSSITCLYTLESGQILLGHSSQGLWHNDIHDLNLEYWPDATLNDQEIPSRDIMTMVDQHGLYWFFSYDAGLMSWNPQTQRLEIYNTSEGNSPSNRFKFGFLDSRNTLWACSYDKGLLYLNRESNTLEKIELPPNMMEIFKDLRVNHISEDHLGILWISTAKGLFRFNPFNRQIQNINDMVSSDTNIKFCWTSIETRDQSHWFTTGPRIFRLSNGEMLELSSNKSATWFLYQDSNDLIFAGSTSGIQVYNKFGDLLHIPKLEEALEDVAVYGVLEGGENHYWITTNRGLIRWDSQRGNIIGYGLHQGLLSTEFNLYSIGRLTDQRIYLGSISGIHILESNQVISPEVIPRFFLDEIWINQRRIQELRNGVSPIGLKELTLDPRENYLTLGFDQLNFNGETWQKEYNLIGLTNQWTDMGNQSQVSFVNLAPGKYQFQLKLTNATGESTISDPLNIEILAPFYKRLWFFLLLLMILGATVYLIISYIIKLNQEIELRSLAEKRNSELNSSLEKLVLDRTQELQNTLEQLQQTQDQMIQREKMSSLGDVVAGVAHELNSPLGVAILSSSYIDEQLEKLYQSMEREDLTRQELAETIKELRETSDKLDMNLNRTADLVKNFKQVAMDKNQRDIIEFDMCASIRSLLYSISSQFKRQNIRIIQHIPKSFQINSRPGELSQVISNILMNNVLHAFRKPFDKKEKMVTIAMTYNKHELTLRIRDNGIGMDEEKLKLIFDPFYTNHRETKGTGLGLNIVYLVVTEKLMGNINVDSSPGVGTEFIIRLPIYLEC
ncbi:MAG: ATP-binding protein [Spirochaetaceae bacterium]|jgi:signal transduction histidine kinase|nr:ATP-binding protein [Spirochaetaceae bacterium]